MTSPLLKIANSQLSARESGSFDERARIDSKVTLLQEELSLIAGNLARAKDQDAFDAIEAERVKVKAELSVLLERRKCLGNSAFNEDNNRSAAQQEVEKALSQLKNIQRITSSPDGRAEIRTMLDELE